MHYHQLAVSGVLVDGFDNVLGWLSIAIVLFELFAFLDACFRRGDAFPAVDKQTKPFWLIVLALSVAVTLIPIGMFSFMLALAGLVAAIVYMVDVRPRVRAITPQRRGGFKGRLKGGKKDGRNHTGPYGPW